MDSNEQPPRTPRAAALRILAATAVALVFALGVYALLQSVRPSTGVISFSFLLVLPAAVCAFIAYVADPWGERRLRTYLLVPVWVMAAVILLSVLVLHEGVICILILSPLWLLAGLAGSGLTYVVRRRLRRGRTYCLAMLALPILAIQAEPAIPLPDASVTVARSIEIDAPAERIWPLLRGIPDVHPGEGRWNLSQDVIGLPRPLGAELLKDGLGAERTARWGDQVSFRERIVDWAPGQRIGWRFIFDDQAGWRFADRHLMPDSPYFRVTTGGYRLEPLGPDRSRLTLETRYWMRTPVNAYSALWGELFLGDLENNLLALVRGRAEKSPVALAGWEKTG